MDKKGGAIRSCVVCMYVGYNTLNQLIWFCPDWRLRGIHPRLNLVNLDLGRDHLESKINSDFRKKT